MIKINFSGHPVSGYEIAPFIGVNLDMESPLSLEATVKEALVGLVEYDALKKGVSAEIILPGMSPVGAILLAVWHGVFGSFPIIRWAVRTETGFVFKDEIQANLNTIRLASRTLRKEEVVRA